ncbi:glycosyltransferase [Paenibacillus naphthalenovorans]|uniref:Group 1 glycosyl transferase n=1 Tax=Paenibacillus naphthalenovorans TaxID=162209 RepID=A0A0U2M155_9BACL|nr:glycosyltransferase [Paenibacillus naphthalenovorans]ALS20720.1 group 1 glycosyl transferase [Paenibacillus naphthalenovorans]
MKNILFLTHLYPYPPNDGGKIVSFNTLKHLAEYGHHITVCTFYSKEKDDLSTFPLEMQVYGVPVDYANTLGGGMKNLISPLSYNMEKYVNRQMRELVFSLLSALNIDIVYVDHLHMAYYGRLIKQTYPHLIVVLRQHNVESLIMKRVAEEERNPIKKLYFQMQYAKLNAYESSICADFDECIMITQEDLNLMEKMNHRVRLSLLPAGVDMNKYVPLDYRQNEWPTITFLGSLAWMPNIQGVTWFMENVFPSLLRQVPNIQFYIVGKNPPESIVKYESQYPKNVHVTGFVEDERPYIAASDVFVVPLKIGGGMRIKILNALAMKKPVVTTSIGAEGIHLKEGSFEVADSSADMEKTILKLLNNKDLAGQMGELGYQEVQAHYSNQLILEKHAANLDHFDSPVHDHKMNVMYVTHSKKKGGAEQSLIHLINHMDTSLYNIYLLCPQDTEYVDEIKTPHKRLHMELGSIKKNIAAYIQRNMAIIHLVRKHNIHIVHANGWRAPWYVLFAKYFTKAKTIWHHRDAMESKFYTWLLPHFFDQVICISDFVKSTIKVKRKCAVVYNGIEQKNDASLEKQRKFKEDGILVIGVIGRIVEWKRYDYIIKALSIFTRKFNITNWKLNIYGDTAVDGSDAYLQQLKDLVAELGLEYNINFKGHTRTPIKAMGECDVTINFSDKEPFGRVIIESLLAKTPVIVANSGGAHEIIARTEGGFICQDGDIDHLAHQIKEIYDLSEHQYESLSSTGYENVKKFFDAKNKSRDVSQIYNRLTKKAFLSQHM